MPVPPVLIVERGLVIIIHVSLGLQRAPLGGYTVRKEGYSLWYFFVFLVWYSVFNAVHHASSGDMENSS
jgi:hypothetical protein